MVKSQYQAVTSKYFFVFNFLKLKVGNIIEITAN